MAKEAQEKLSDDTITCLEQAKKGKARKFVLVCKGAAIVSLIVYKKGSLEKYKKEAKEAGSGLVSHGVVTGSGMELNFQLARSDGFERPPVKPTTLKDYLSEKGDFRCKPIFEIVDAPLVVLDDEDPTAKRFLELQPKALAACDQHPDRAAEISALCEQIGKLLEGEGSDQATSKIDDLAKLLSTLTAGSTTPPVAPPVPPPTPPPVQPAPQPTATTQQPDGTASFTARLAALKPDLEGLIAAKSPAAEDLKLQVSQAGYHARKKEFSEANAILDEVEAELKKLSGGNPLAAAWGQRRAAFEPKFTAFTKSGPPETVQKLQKIWALANDKANAQDFKTALQAVNQIEPLIVAPPVTMPTADVSSLSDEQLTARAKQVRETWLQAKETVDKQLTALQKSLKSTGDKVFSRLAEFGIGGVSKRLQTGLLVSLMNLEQAKGDARQKSMDQALKAIADFQKLLTGDKSIALIEANPFGVQISLRQTLGGALTEMQRSLLA
jgi:hypothetical protein